MLGHNTTLLFLRIVAALAAAPNDERANAADRMKCLGIIASIVCFCVVVAIVIGVLKAKQALGV